MEENLIIGEGSEYPLDGVLTLPVSKEENEKFPVVILVQGSGALDKDETIYATKPFLDIAKYLATQGIASVRFNKRTFQLKKEVAKHNKIEPITVKEEVIDDVLAAKKLIEEHPNIDNSNIFILGHSLGGMLAPRIDHEAGGFKGIIILAGSPRTLREIIIEQNNASIETLNSILQKIAKKQIQKLNETFDQLDTMSDEEAKKTKFVGKTTMWYFKEMESFDTQKAIKEIKKPTLILQGSSDVQVSPEKDFELYKELGKDNEYITFKLYPNLNHLFMPAIYGSINKVKKEYSVESHIDLHVLVDISEFIVKNL